MTSRTRAGPRTGSGHRPASVSYPCLKTSSRCGDNGRSASRTATSLIHLLQPVGVWCRRHSGPRSFSPPVLLSTGF